MLNFFNGDRPRSDLPPMPGLNAAPFQWLPSGVAFIRRQVWPIVGIGALGLALGVGYLAFATPEYTAIATLSIDPSRAHPVGGHQSPADWQSESAYIESQVALIQSPATLRGVVEQQHLDQNKLFQQPAPGPVGELFSSIKQLLPGLGTNATGLDPTARAQAKAGAVLWHMMDVSRVGTTSVVEVRVRTPDRALSARLANAVTAAYMAQQLVAISETTRRAGGWLQSRIGELRGQAVSADRAVQEYKAKNNIVDVTTGAGTGLMNEQQLGELNVQVASARSRVAASQARYEQAQASMSNGVTQGVPTGMVTDTQPNPVMSGLQQQYLDASRRGADLVARLGPNHGSVILQRKVIQELQHSIQTEQARQTATYRADFGAAKADLHAIESRLTEQVAAAAQTNIERSELRSLQSSADAYRGIYENFLRRFTQAMQDESYPISDARVAAVALAPMDRSYPRASISLAIALTLGLALGVMVAVVREALDVTVRTVSQLRLATGLDNLGTVLETEALACRLNRGWRRASRASALLGHMLVPDAFRQAATNPDSEIAGAVHGVRVAAARQSAQGRDVRVIGCVSMLPGEGTSTFAANLAFALAADGQRTVLLDWNVKFPWLTEMMSVRPRMGVQELMAREASLTDVALNDTQSGLTFVGQSIGDTSRMQPGPAKVRAMLADLRDRYDVVVLDLPPMQAGSTAVLLSEMVDGFVLIAQWGHTSQPLLTETLSRTAAMDTLFLGTVLSHCDPKRMRLYLGDAPQVQGARAPQPMAA
jgi:succinoglycan biosynthesis transport protein ExoP